MENNLREVNQKKTTVIITFILFSIFMLFVAQYAYVTVFANLANSLSSILYFALFGVLYMFFLTIWFSVKSFLCEAVGTTAEIYRALFAEAVRIIRRKIA